MGAHKIHQLVHRTSVCTHQPFLHPGLASKDTTSIKTHTHQILQGAKSVGTPTNTSQQHSHAPAITRSRTHGHCGINLKHFCQTPNMKTRRIKRPANKHHNTIETHQELQHTK